MNKLLSFFVGTCLSLLTTSAFAQIQTLKHWQVSIDGGGTFRPITVPSTIEDSIDLNFDGVSIYQTQLPADLILQVGQRAILKFCAVATQATVYVNEQQVATHLGGWTPFWVDITDVMSQSAKNRPPVLKVVVDEKVGHNTQGFLPIVTKHFGGIWQPVQLHITGSSWLLEELAVVRAQPNHRMLRVELPISSNPASLQSDKPLHIRLSLAEVQAGEDRKWNPLSAEFSKQAMSQQIQGSGPNRPLELWISEIRLADELKSWSPQDPQLYALKAELLEDSRVIDAHEFTFGVRDFHTSEDRFVLNRQPVTIRGVLNWGYAPPSVAPSLDKQWMIDEIKFAQQRGFNLMKFCLWIPPQEYLDLCDQLGMLAWVEYPTWHPRLDAQHLAELRQEYSEFFAYDRNHPCIVLRSLTCETGPSADIEVVRSLYNQCKSMIPDAVVEDDSSWISWNRVHDFYDDHPYGNNHTWVSSLNELRQYMATRQKMPLALGEAIAADSWLEPNEQAIRQAASDPAHGSWFVADNDRWQKELVNLTAARNREFDPRLLYPHSVHYGMLMRKYQIETFHRELPNAGYVVSVLRDFPKASMGLIDGNGRPKTLPQDWQFQRDEMLLLQTSYDRRSFESGSTEVISVTHKSTLTNSQQSAIELGKMSLTLRDGNHQILWSNTIGVEQAEAELATLQFSVKSPRVEKPQRVILEAKWQSHNSPTALENSWPVWVFPATDFSSASVQLHASAKAWAESLGLSSATLKNETQSATDALLMLPTIAQRLDDELLNRLEQGQNVLLIPDGQSGSFPLQQHWFLRGSVVALPKSNAVSHEAWHAPFEQSLSRVTGEKADRLNMLVELQHFDLAGAVVPNIGHYLGQTDPMILLWDNHDLRETRTHGLAFQLPVGQGRLLVSAINHTGSTNAAGRWLLEQWLGQLAAPDHSPEPSSKPSGSQLLEQLRSELSRQQMSLASSEWRFQPDPPQRGLAEGWFKPNWDDSSWSSIRIDRHWEGQGHAALDNWAWYRTTLTLPDDFGDSAYLNLNGIDDYADIYVNGTKIGSVGDINRKETAFETRLSLDISSQIASTRNVQLSIAVYDWYGTGGIFRPITISSQPISQAPLMLVK